MLYHESLLTVNSEEKSSNQKLEQMQIQNIMNR